MIQPLEFLSWASMSVALIRAPQHSFCAHSTCVDAPLGGRCCPLFKCTWQCCEGAGPVVPVMVMVPGISNTDAKCAHMTRNLYWIPSIFHCTQHTHNTYMYICNYLVFFPRIWILYITWLSWTYLRSWLGACTVVGNLFFQGITAHHIQILFLIRFTPCCLGMLINWHCMRWCCGPIVSWIVSSMTPVL